MTPAALPDAVEQILGVPVPAFEEAHRLGAWLAARGVGLVGVADPQDFSWPGHWIAVTDSGRALVMFGVPSGALAEGLRDGERILEGFVVARHDLDLERRMDRLRGTVSSIVIAARTAGPAHEVERCRAIAGRGLDGDRYAAGGGTFAADGRLGQDLTLIDEASLAAAGLSPDPSDLAARDARIALAMRDRGRPEGSPSGCAHDPA